jgi:ParB-like chromosome segregation protein Spo0J
VAKKNTAVEEVETATGAVAVVEQAAVVETPMPKEYSVWETRYFDPRELIVDHTQNGRRFGIKNEKVLSLKEDFLNPHIGQLQECGVYWNATAGGFQLAYGYHRQAAAAAICADGNGPDTDGCFLLRCVIVPGHSINSIMEVNLAENSDKTKTPLTPMDKAYIINRMLEAGYTQSDIARKLGYSKTLISQVKNFIDFPLKVQKLIDTGKITQAGAIELVDLKDNPDELTARVDSIINANGKVGTSAVRAARRGDSQAEADEVDSEAYNEGEEGEEAAPVKATKARRSLKEIMEFLRDYSEVEEGVDPDKTQAVLKVILRFAEGQIKEKAAQKAINRIVLE